MVGLRVSAVIIKHETEPEILLIRHRRRGRSYPVLPGGKMEDGETVEKALIREVREESGLDIVMGNLLFVADVIEPGQTRHMVNLVFSGTIVGGEFRPTLHGSPSPIEKGDQAYFLPLAALEEENLHPPIAAHILAAYGNGFQDAAGCLGNVWKEFGEDGSLGR